MEYGMSDISALKERNNIKTLHLFLLMLITMGLYSIVWIHKTQASIEEITKIKTMSFSYFIWYLALLGIGSFAQGLGNLDVILLGNVLLVASGLLVIIWVFRARGALRTYALAEHNFELRMNVFYTLLFLDYYVNYCINDLPAAKEKCLAKM